VAGAIVFSTAPIEAKCGFRLYRVEIEIRSQVTGEPISGVRLTAFANGADSEMRIRKADPNDPISSDRGRMVRTYVFDTYSGPGILSVDRCNARVRILELIATHPNYQAKRISIKKVPNSAKAPGAVDTIMIPLSLDPLNFNFNFNFN